MKPFRGAFFTSVAAAAFWLTAVFVSPRVAVAALVAGMLYLILAGWRRYNDDDCGYTTTIFGLPGNADEAQAHMDDQFQAITEQLRAKPGENVE